MNTQVVARLEALLARIRSRAGEPRDSHTGGALVSVTDAAIAAAARPSEHPSIVDDDEVGDWPTRPPPAPLKAQIEAAAIGEPREPPREQPPADQQVQEPVQEERPAGVAGPAEEVAPEKAYESRERLVAATSVAPEELSAEAAAEAPAETGAEVEVEVQAEADAGYAPAAEIAPSSAPEVEAVVEEAPSDPAVAEADTLEEEETPASSRRPVAQQPEERIAQIAFGAEEPREPLHTPPPESGRLPAAAVVEFDGDVTGVRDSAPVAPLRAGRSASAREQTPSEMPTKEVDSRPAQPVAQVHELSPEPTHPQLPETDAVAELIGEAQRFSPGTLVALLDASLAL